MWTDRDLLALTPEERSDLARRLAVLHDPLPHFTAQMARRRRRFTDLMVLCCAGLIPWIVALAYLLPRHYDAGHWQAAWIGFDVMELIGLGVTAWAGWRGRQLLVLSAMATATLLVVDAWFDVLTSSSRADVISSLLMAAFVELPLAAVLFRLVFRLFALTTTGARKLAGSDQARLPFWKVPLFSIEDPILEVIAHDPDLFGGAPAVAVGEGERRDVPGPSSPEPPSPEPSLPEPAAEGHVSDADGPGHPVGRT